MNPLLFGLLCAVPVWTGGNPYPTIGSIPLPAGYHRLTTAPSSFGAWLRTISLKKATTVYLYNGQPKANQEAQFAVLSVSVGHEELQQCADAVMRRRAAFDKYLREVFMYCSTRTLARQLGPAVYSGVGPGDVLIRGGSPGHAMLVVDVAEDEKGHRVYLLAQSYMPAQDIHIVKNPTAPEVSPWYRAETTTSAVITPEYEFKINELRAWPK